MTRQIYVDSETKQAEEQILKEDKKFNFTKFYKDELINLRNRLLKEKLDIPFLNYKISEIKKDVEEKQNLLKNFEEMKKEAEQKEIGQEELKQEIIKQEIDKEKRIKERVKEMKKAKRKLNI